MKNGLLGDALYRYFSDNRGALGLLFPDVPDSERTQLIKRIQRELNPNDEGAKLGVRDAEQLISRVRKYGGWDDLRPYLTAATQRMTGDNGIQFELNGRVDDEVLDVIRQLTQSPHISTRLDELATGDVYGLLTHVSRAHSALDQLTAEINADLERRDG